MTRFVTPVFLGGVAVAVAVFNQRPDRKIVFPLLDRVTTDPAGQGWLTVGILGALAGLSAVWAIVEIVRARRED